MKPLVIRSLNDATGQRCADIRAVADAFDWVECRRDPEDGTGWRHTGAGQSGFASAGDAEAAARASLAWIEGT